MTDNPSDTVLVDFPEPFLNKKGIDAQYVREAVAAVSYYNGTLSEKEACDMVRVSRRQFEERILPKFRLTVVGGTPEDIDIEIQGV